MKFKICSQCYSHLDHGERCDCKKEATPAGAGSGQVKTIPAEDSNRPHGGCQAPESEDVAALDKAAIIEAGRLLLSAISTK